MLNLISTKKIIYGTAEIVLLLLVGTGINLFTEEPLKSDMPACRSGRPGIKYSRLAPDEPSTSTVRGESKQFTANNDAVLRHSIAPASERRMVGLYSALNTLSPALYNNLQYSSKADSSHDKYGNKSLEKPDNDFSRMFEIGVRYNYFTPDFTVKSDSLKSYYAAKYTPNPSASFVASYTDLEFNARSISGLGLDFKFSPLPPWQVVFSYETFNDVRATISGSGTFTTLNNGFADSDVITLEKIHLITVGVNYTVIMYPSPDNAHLSVTRLPFMSLYKAIEQYPPFPSIKLNLGLGLQQITYNAIDHWTSSELNTTTKTTINSFTDSISEIKPAFLVSLDICPAKSFLITISGRYLDLSSQAKWGGDKANITFNGLSFGLGAMLGF